MCHGLLPYEGEDGPKGLRISNRVKISRFWLTRTQGPDARRFLLDRDNGTAQTGFAGWCYRGVVRQGSARTVSMKWIIMPSSGYARADPQKQVRLRLERLGRAGIIFQALRRNAKEFRSPGSISVRRSGQRALSRAIPLFFQFYIGVGCMTCVVSIEFHGPAKVAMIVRSTPLCRSCIAAVLVAQDMGCDGASQF